MTKDRPIGEAFMLLGELALKLGVLPMNALPGLWEHEIPGIDGGTWRWAVNGHDEPMSPEGKSVKVPPYHCYLEWCGWPAGIFTPFEGKICAGSMANEDTFIDALKTAIEAAGKKLNRESFGECGTTIGSRRRPKVRRS